MTSFIDPKDRTSKRTGAPDSTRLPMIFRASLVLIPLLLATPVVSSAYADAGTGAFVYQAAYAAFLAGTFYLRKVLDYFWSRRTKNARPDGSHLTNRTQI
jgi:hypothetical protein